MPLTTFLIGSVDRHHAGALFLQAGRPAARHHRWLVGGAQIQLHGMPSGARGPDHRVHDAAALPGSRLEGSAAAHADRRRRARQSRMADGLPEQSVADREAGRDGSRRRAAISARAHAHFLFLRWRDPEAGAILRGHVVAGRAVHRRTSWSRSPIRSAPWRGSCSPAKARPA